MTEAITITQLGEANAQIRALAGLDGRHAPGGPLLMALVDGEPRAALSLEDDGVVADPFRPTAALVELLRRRAELMDAEARPGALRRMRAWASRRTTATA